MERKEKPLITDQERRRLVTERAAPTTFSIAIFAVAVALLFGGMYFFFPESYRQTVSAPPVVGTTPPSATTGQGGEASEAK
jgi:hypothetical protein